jgi:hypothetical protein
MRSAFDTRLSNQIDTPSSLQLQSQGDPSTAVDGRICQRRRQMSMVHWVRRLPYFKHYSAHRILLSGIITREQVRIFEPEWRLICEEKTHAFTCTYYTWSCIRGFV